MGPVTEVLAADTAERRAAAVARAAEALGRGELVAIPTETVYGLAANALDPEAVARIYAAKGRPSNNPLIAHVASVEMARRCVARWPESAERLAEAFWPGPITLVLERSAEVPDIVTAGGSTVAVRWPAHPIAAAIIEHAGVPLAAPSANRSNELSPTTAAHVARGLEGRVGLVIDGGACEVGIESTVVDLTGEVARVLRPGTVGLGELGQVLGEGRVVDGASAAGADGPMRSPGQLARHYAPRAELLVLDFGSAGELIRALQARGRATDEVHVVHREGVNVVPESFAGVTVLPSDAASFARTLYATLHGLDAAGARVVAVQKPPAGDPAWRGIADRLGRGAAPLA